VLVAGHDGDPSSARRRVGRRHCFSRSVSVVTM
jgi:hypothetical protein